MLQYQTHSSRKQAHLESRKIQGGELLENKLIGAVCFGFSHHQAIFISAPNLSPLVCEFPCCVFTVFSREEATHFRRADGVDRRN